MKPTLRKLSFFDECLHQMQRTLQCFSQPELFATRETPGTTEADRTLTKQEKSHSAGLMRVNRAGEIAAQALYQGQALTARSLTVKNNMQQSAEEEIDHLVWCTTRLRELNSHTSYLDPAWYFGAFCLGVSAGIAGDGWSLAFLAETEHQVCDHLQNHIEHLPQHDERSRAIVAQMHTDEAKHAMEAKAAGAYELPRILKRLMGASSKVMTSVAYWV